MEDMMQLQREAARRVSRMQEHSRRVFEEHNGRPPLPTPPRDAQAAGFAQPTMRAPALYTRHTPPETAPACPREETPACPSPFDGEQWLLLGLALLLFRSGCRPELAVALLYLAM
jgi:hypothetical protein